MCSETPWVNSAQEGRSESPGKARNPVSKQRASSMAAQSRGGARETDQGSTCWERAPRCSGTRAPAHGGDSVLLRQRTPPRPDVLPLSLLAWPCGSAESLASSPTGEENEKQLPGGMPGNGKQTLLSGKGGPRTGGGTRSCSHSHGAGWRKWRWKPNAMPSVGKLHMPREAAAGWTLVGEEEASWPRTAAQMRVSRDPPPRWGPDSREQSWSK